MLLFPFTLESVMKKTTIYELTVCALMTALVCILGPISVPIGPVPVSLTILPLLLSVWLLGTRGALITTGLYLLLGAFGLPVFSGYQGGIQKLLGPTGGYLVGFLFMVLIAGLIMKACEGHVVFSVLGSLLGILAAYILGTAWFMFQMDCTLPYALSVCVLPFIPFDIAKAIAAAAIGKPVQSALKKAQLLPETAPRP